MIRDLGIDEDCAYAQLGLPVKAKDEKKAIPAAPTPEPKKPATHN